MVMISIFMIVLLRPGEMFHEKSEIRMPVNNQVKEDIRINSGYRVIQYDAPSVLHAPVDGSRGGRLDYIQNPEKKESGAKDRGGTGQEGHGDQKARYLVDNDLRAVGFTQDPLGSFRDPAGQGDKCRGAEEVQPRRERRVDKEDD
jgi:hypothetical protein